MLLPQMRQANPMAQGFDLVAISVSRSSSGRSTRSGHPNWRGPSQSSGQRESFHSLCHAILGGTLECALKCPRSYILCCTPGTCTLWQAYECNSNGSSYYSFCPTPFRKEDKSILCGTPSLLLPSKYPGPCSHDLKDRRVTALEE